MRCIIWTYRMLVAWLLGLGVSSCNSDERPCPEEADAMTFAVTLQVSDEASTRATTWGENDSSEAVSYDDAIDINDIHVAILKTDGSPVDMEKLNIYKDTQGRYVYCGKILRSDYTVGNSYRCMVVTNVGTSEVDFTNLGALTYQQTSLPNADEEEQYIPMWGVKSFTIDSDKDTQDLGTIELLRAAVKCRVHLSEELAAQSGLSLYEVTFLSHNTDGYVVPTGYDTTNSTTDLDYNLCFNPTDTLSATEVVRDGDFAVEQDREFTPVEFFADPEADLTTEGGMRSAIGYFCECKAPGSSPYLTVVLKIDDRKVTYLVPFEALLAEADVKGLIRNNVYDLEIMSYKYGLAIKIQTNSTVNWDQTYSYFDFTTDVTFQTIDDKPGNYVIWTKDTYKSVDEDNKVITLASNISLEGAVAFLTPVGATWKATLTADSADDTSNSITFEDGNTYTSGIIDGTSLATFKIKPATEDNSRQHIYTLTFYVEYLTGLTVKVQTLSGWKIVQTY